MQKTSVLLLMGILASGCTKPKTQNPTQKTSNPVIQISAGNAHTCVLMQSGNVRCWGENGSGQLGYGHTKNIGDDETPSGDIELGGKALQISLGDFSSCALLEGGLLRCWGSVGAEKIGDNEVPSSAAPINVGGDIKQISSGSFHTCALLTDGSVSCWGKGDGGRLGYGNTNSLEFPVSKVPLGKE